MDALDHLKGLLTARSKEPLTRPWAVESTIDLHITQLERNLREGAGAYVPRNLLEDAALRFWESKKVQNLKDARLVSYGIALPLGPQRLRLIEDRDRFPALLQGVDQFLPAPKQYRRCYQGLLTGYFAYDPEASEAPMTGRENWEALRNYLGNRSGSILEGDRNPQWAESLQQHPTLLGLDPCLSYGGQLLAGDHAAVDELREVLNISESSWFMRKLYLAQVRAATAKPDADFLELLYRVLDLIKDNGLIRDEGLALVLDRFVQLGSRSMAVSLRDAAVTWWGNPWLQSNAMRWGRVSPEARAMVSEWLKLEFIEAFFTLLAEERSGDNRRLQFWARYVNSIDDIHFALGTDALENRSTDYQVLRRKMAGLVVPLQDHARSNNAFIMRMGSLVVVEFSGYSNACYAYNANNVLPFRFDAPVVLPKGAKNSLKHDTHELRLVHQDYVRGFNSWEERFEAELAKGYRIKPKGKADGPRVRAQQAGPLAQPRQASLLSEQLAPRTPAQPTAPAPRERDEKFAWDITSWKTTNFSRGALSQFANQFGFVIQDLSLPPQGGNLWVRADDSNLGINEVLMKWGFEYKSSRNAWWWRGK